MNAWRTPIRCYVSPVGNNKISEWYSALSAQKKADTDEFLKNMRMTKEWAMPDYRPRLKDCQGLGELRWFSCDKQHSLIGFFMDGSWYAVVGCTHKQQTYKPPSALESAKKYKRQIESGQVETVEYNF